jgi:2-polyprenyl-3-methyl-5-hydroxy-6-metoxy-1,4-benzoquinol methylase
LTGGYSLKLKYLLSSIKMMNTRGIFRIIKDWQSVIRFHYIHAALDAGFIETLRTPMLRDEIIKKLQVEREEILDALLDVGVSLGELSYSNGLYSLKGKVSKALTGETGDALAALIQANVTYYNSAYRNAADRMRGAELGNDISEIGDLVARVSKLQEPLIKNFIEYTVKNRKSMNILEIGCGSGILLKSAFKANSNTVGVGIDLDEDVVIQAKKNIEAWGLSDRFNILHGDIRVADLKEKEPFDLITMYNVLYYFEPCERLELFKNLKSKLSVEGRIAVITTVQSHGNDPFSASLNLANCTLKGVTPVPELHSIEKLFKGCGFTSIETTRIMPGSAFYSVLAS